MINLALVYRDQMIRAVLGTGPAILAREANTTALDRMAARLVDAEEAIAQLRAKGYGERGQTLVEVVRAMPAAPVSPAQLHEVLSPR
jgi:hypothetical protein